MGFSKLADVAKQLSGNNETTNDNQKEGSSQPSGRKGWDKVGADAKEAFDNYQADQAQGKDPNYTEIGGVAKAAFSAYNRGDGAESSVAGEQTKEEDIGREVVAGLSAGEMGKGLKVDEKITGVQADGNLQTSEGLQNVREDFGEGWKNDDEDEKVLPGDVKRTTGSGMVNREETVAEDDEKSMENISQPLRYAGDYGTTSNPAARAEIPGMVNKRSSSAQTGDKCE